MFEELALPVLGLGLQAANYFQSQSDKDKAQRKLDYYSNQPISRYNYNPAYNRYYQTAVNEAASPYGFTQAERNRFNTNVTGQLNTNRAYASNMTGGSLGKAINFLDTRGRLGAVSDFAAQDAGLRRSMQTGAYGRQFNAANAFQGIDNMNTTAQNNRLFQLLSAYGQAVQSNKDYGRNLLGGVGRDLTTAGLMNMGGGDDGTIPFAGARNSIYDFFTPPNTSYRVDPSAYLKVNPLNYRNPVR